jgi:hypothetical protein
VSGIFTPTAATSWLRDQPPQLLPDWILVMQGLFIPTFHKVYWIGLLGTLPEGIAETAGINNRTWDWIDGVTPTPGKGNKNYVHWGTWMNKRLVRHCMCNSYLSSTNPVRHVTSSTSMLPPEV